MGLNSPKWIPSEEEIDEKLETSNERELFVVGQIIIERIIDKIIVEKFLIPEKILDDTRFPMQLRIDLLSESDLVKGDLKTNIRKINQIRNRYSHRINPEPNEQRIANYIRELQYLGPVSKPNDRYTKYRICVIRTFSALVKL